MKIANQIMRMTYSGLTGCAVLILLVLPGSAGAHCDTLDGPVVADARKALESGNVAVVLKWVAAQDEPEVRAAFAQAQAVRRLSEDAKKLADRYFFETVVRIHRMGEGAPYTGLKPAGTQTDPGIRAADTAIESGSVNALLQRMSEEVAQGIQRRFATLMDKKAHASESVARGREYVAAYVEFIHYVESLHTTAGDAGKETPPMPHKH
jgi:hypothetical protein